MKRLLLITVLMLPSLSSAAELRAVDPGRVGISAERLHKITAFTERQVGAGRHAGFVTMVARHGKIVHYEAVGKYGLENDKTMDRDALFRIYSMTKPITAVALMTLYEDGAFQMQDPVSKFIPELADLALYSAEGSSDETFNPTIEQLMTHTAGFTYGFRPTEPVDAMYRDTGLLKSKSSDEFIAQLAKLPLAFRPGTRYHYGVGYEILGVVIERISGQPLDAFLRERIFTPLDMQDTFFSVPADKLSRLAGIQYWDQEQGAMAVVPPEQVQSFTDVTFFSGGGGLVSTAMDYMIFCEMLRRGGTYNGARILGPKTIQYMTMNHLTEAIRNNGAGEFPESHLYKGQYYGLGFGVMLNPGISEVISSQGEYSWGGIADTKFWIDPEEDLVAIVMTQLFLSPWETRYQMKIATYQALTELGNAANAR